MLKITLYQMRRNIGRLIAAGIAIAIGTAFVAATFVGGQVLIKTSENAMTVSLADSDLSANSSVIVETDEGSDWQTIPFTGEELTKIAALNGVDEISVSPEFETLTLVAGDKNEMTAVALTASNPKLQLLEITEGKAPANDSEIALPAKVLERLGLSVGDQVTAQFVNYEQVDSEREQGLDEEAALAAATTTFDYTVTGVTEDYRGAFTYTSGAALLTQGSWEQIQQVVEKRTDFVAYRVMIAAEAGADLTALQTDMNEITGKRPTYTKQEVAENQFSSLTGEANIMMTFVLVFAALALFVAGLVITNTFQVLVAQRAKTLALLRCVGANKKQIRNSVLVEAGILGLASSIAGIIMGLGLMQITLSILKQFEFARGLQEWISIPATAIWVPLLAGTTVTVLASLVPARIATKVPPLAALRPQEGSGEASKKASRIRLVFAFLLIGGGAALMAVGLFLSKADDPALELALLTGIFGGMLSFIGLIMSSVVWVPKVVGAVGNLLAVGASSKLAQANTVRNPRRTAATATALFIGVTLVAMMSVGAATARESMNALLDDQFPVDIIGDPGWTGANPTEITPEMLDRVNAIDGVEAATVVNTTYTIGAYIAPVTDADGNQRGGDMQTMIIGLSHEDARKVLRSPDLADQYDDNSAIMPTWAGSALDGQSVRFFYDQGSEDGEWIEDPTKRAGFDQGIDMTAIQGTTGTFDWITTPAALDKLVDLIDDPNYELNQQMIIKVKDVTDAGATVDALRDVFGEDSVNFSGAVMERIMFQQTIDIVLLVLVGLLAVAVVIALIGVANTLSLSVIERRRESATLRAIGMSKKQLKRSLGIEGMLIAGIGALLGVVLGIVYAIIGSTLMLGGFADVKVSIRWQDLLAILAISIIAGFLASVLPARGAANTSPVEALAVD